MKQKEFISPGALNKLGTILSGFSSENILLVRGNQSFTKSGAQETLNPILKKYNVTEFSDFSVNPKLEEAQLGYKLFSKNKCTLIIAVGGGSVIDTAKIIKYLSIKENKQNSNIPFIAIPTTAGTGSEVTHFAVVYVEGVKHSYAIEALVPSLAIVDANLLKGQSKYQIAVSGLDAMAQGIESFWSIHSTDESMSYSEKAIKLIWENLKDAINGENDALNKIAEGSNWAGKAINIAKTTAAHALSYEFTSRFKLPHGHAVALFLPFFISYHKNICDSCCVDPRGKNHVHNQMNRIASIMHLNWSTIENDITIFLNKIGININFSKLNISSIEFQNAIKNINQERLKNNPGKITDGLIEKAYKFNNYV